MKPYYDHNGITIYHGDCKDIIPYLDPVDLVLTDPPYGIKGGKGSNFKKGKSHYQTESFEDTPEYLKKHILPYIGNILMKTKRAIFTPGTRMMMFYPTPDDVGCFFSPASASWGKWGHVTFSPILYYGKDPRHGKGQSPTSYKLHEVAEKNGHPCPKPIKAWTFLLNKGSLPGETVLDPFMGSGTTLRAAKDLGRKAIGIEIEEKYCEIAAKRLSQEVLNFD